MSNIEEVKSGELATPFDMPGSGSTTLDSSDIQVPRINLLQPTSEGVGVDYQGGQFLHSGTGEVLGGVGDSFSIIPFHVQKMNTKYNMDVAPKEWICMEPYDGTRPWEESDYTWVKRDGTSQTCSRITNVKTFITHAMIVDDFIDSSLPISFITRSSAGKDIETKLATHFASVSQMNRMRIAADSSFKPIAPYTVAWDVSSEFVQKPNQKYFRWVLKRQSKKVSQEHIDICLGWEKAVSAKASSFQENPEKAEVQEQAPPQRPKVKNHAPGGDSLEGEEMPF